MKQHFFIIINDDYTEFNSDEVRQALAGGLYEMFDSEDIEVYPVKSVQITESKKND